MLLLGVSLVLVAGCAVGPDYIKPAAPEPQAWIEKEDPKIKSEPADFAAWWELFNDPVLDELIDTAYRQNLDLRIAGIRILEARAQLGIVIGEQYPQVQAARGEYSYSGLSENAANTTRAIDSGYGEVSLGFDAAWELDFWGKFRRAVQSEYGNLDASIANYEDILVTLTAEVARIYIFIRTVEARLAIARENVKIQERSLQIAEVRFKAGDVTELDVAQARTLLSDTRASIPRLEARLRQAMNALAQLLGLLPGDVAGMLEGPRPIPTVSPEVAVGVPAELLRRRPDIRLAEAQVAAQSPRIGVAKADLYPHFSLFGSIGLRSSDAALTAAGYPGGSSLSDLWDSDSVEFFGGAGFSWDILNYGRIQNRVRVQDARFQQRVVNYKNTVLKAYQEVEDAIAAFLRSQEEVRFLMESAKAATRSVELSQIQYREGLVDFQRVIDSQRSQAQAQDLLTGREGSVAENLVAVYKALGGGWQIRLGKDFVPQETKEEMQKRTDWGELLSIKEVEMPPSKEAGKRWRRPDW
jgi:NodT family efflux transporter outer membrane factor (OMF) lipoprotein